jgi:hydrogenase maturation protease
MNENVLVAGVGNVFLGDDGFGVEVAHRLARMDLPGGTRVQDFGIRGLHLAYELVEPHDMVIIADAVQRGDPPGTVSLLELDLSNDEAPSPAGAHVMDLHAVFAWAKTLGGALPRVLLLGCEPLRVEEGEGLSNPVEEAVDRAVAAVRELVRRQLAGVHPAHAGGLT